MYENTCVIPGTSLSCQMFALHEHYLCYFDSSGAVSVRRLDHLHAKSSYRNGKKITEKVLAPLGFNEIPHFAALADCIFHYERRLISHVTMTIIYMITYLSNFVCFISI